MTGTYRAPEITWFRAEQSDLVDGGMPLSEPPAADWRLVAEVRGRS